MIQKIYALLNVFYLKLIQYDKYLEELDLRDLIDETSCEINQLIEHYNESLALTEMSLKEMFFLSPINYKFNHHLDQSCMKNIFREEYLDVISFKDHAPM